MQQATQTVQVFPGEGEPVPAADEVWSEQQLKNLQARFDEVPAADRGTIRIYGMGGVRVEFDQALSEEDVARRRFQELSSTILDAAKEGKGLKPDQVAALAQTLQPGAA